MKLLPIEIFAKVLPIVLAITASVQLSTGQSSNPVKKDCVAITAIELQGFRSGMDMSDILRTLRIPRSKVKSVETEATGPDGKKYRENIGWEELEYYDIENRLPGVFSIKFDFVEGTLIDMLIGYDGSIAWSSVSEFAFSVGKSLKLPNEGWDFGKEKSPLGREVDIAAFHLCEGRLIAMVGKHDWVEKQLGKDINPLTGNQMNDLQVILLKDDAMHLLSEDEVLQRVKKKTEEKSRENEKKKKIFKP